MKKEEYLKEKERLQHEIRLIKKQLKNLEVEYINKSELSKFSVGEKVKVIKGRSGVAYGFVTGATVDFYDNPCLQLNKCKKDGTMSKLKLYYFPNFGDKVEKI